MEKETEKSTQKSLNLLQAICMRILSITYDNLKGNGQRFCGFALIKNRKLLHVLRWKHSIDYCTDSPMYRRPMK